jgi:hypothetical protein
VKEVNVELRAHGTVLVADEWTDEKIEDDPDAFDDAILNALPDNMNTLTFEVEDGVLR